jgi:hypothetical protein
MAMLDALTVTACTPFVLTANANTDKQIKFFIFLTPFWINEAPVST